MHVEISASCSHLKYLQPNEVLRQMPRLEIYVIYINIYMKSSFPKRNKGQSQSVLPVQRLSSKIMFL